MTFIDDAWKKLTPRQRRTAERMHADEHGVLLEVFCRFWPEDHGAKWDEWLTWWDDNRGNWLGPRRAFGVWLRQQEDARARGAR